MRVIVAGSRSISSYSVVESAIERSGFAREITEVVSGGAKGADVFGERWAQLHGVPVHRFPAEWQTFGRRAGFVRNAQMIEYADALVLIWDGLSRGAAHTLLLAEKAGLRRFAVSLLGVAQKEG